MGSSFFSLPHIACGESVTSAKKQYQSGERRKRGREKGQGTRLRKASNEQEWGEKKDHGRCLAVGLSNAQTKMQSLSSLAETSMDGCPREEDACRGTIAVSNQSRHMETADRDGERKKTNRLNLDVFCPSALSFLSFSSSLSSRLDSHTGGVAHRCVCHIVLLS